MIFYWKTDTKKNHDEQSSTIWEEYNSNLGPCGDSFSGIVGSNGECKLSSFFFFILSMKQKVEYFLIIEFCCWISCGKNAFPSVWLSIFEIWGVKIKGWKCLFVFYTEHQHIYHLTKHIFEIFSGINITHLVEIKEEKREKKWNNKT